MDRNEFIMKRVQEHYDELVSLGYEVVALFLQGSQNYELDIYSDEYMSDIDTKAIVLPTLNDICLGKEPYSHTHVRANNEHIDIKDVRVMFDMFKKQNNAYIELLFTQFKIVNPKYADLTNKLLEHAEEIAHMHKNQALRCLSGMSQEKFKALEHPYPNTLIKIEKFGYDPKQLHHILRLYDFMGKYVKGVEYSKCLIPDDIEYLKSIKVGILPLEEARTLAQDYVEKISAMKKEFSTQTEEINKDMIDFLNELKVELIRRALISELKI